MLCTLYDTTDMAVMGMIRHARFVLRHSAVLGPMSTSIGSLSLGPPEKTENGWSRACGSVGEPWGWAVEVPLC